jgi:hypothetical protein
MARVHVHVTVVNTLDLQVAEHTQVSQYKHHQDVHIECALLVFTDA